MTKAELKKEAIQYAVDYPTNYGKGYKHKDLRIAYLAGAEPREKRIEELIALINAERERQEKCDDVHLRKIADLEKENAELKQAEKGKVVEHFEAYGQCRDSRRIAELEAQIEKLIDFVLSKTECCDVCPMTDTCINSEGTCPYAGILAKGEEEVSREWLMQFISKEIKEK